MNSNNHLNKVLFSFDSLNKKLFSDFHLVDTFSDHFSFLLVNQKNSNTLASHCNRLNNIIKNSLINRKYKVIAKFVYYTINVISMKAKLFSIRCRINHTV